MLHKGYLDQIGVEIHQKLIVAIVNWPTPNWKTFMGSLGLFEGIFGPTHDDDFLLEASSNWNF